MTRIFLLSLLCLILTVSCRKSKTYTTTPVSPEYFAFGVTYGECGGDCATFYAIRDGKMYPDKMNSFYQAGGKLNFSDMELAKNKYEKAKSLPGNLPQYLIDHPNKTFGCPDCRDQGLIYIEANINSSLMHWKIDPDIEKQPVEIREYVKQLTDVFNNL